jgi:hypothetical protein
MTTNAQAPRNPLQRAAAERIVRKEHERIAALGREPDTFRLKAGEFYREHVGFVERTFLVDTYTARWYVVVRLKQLKAALDGPQGVQAFLEHLEAHGVGDLLTAGSHFAKAERERNTARTREVTVKEIKRDSCGEISQIREFVQKERVTPASGLPATTPTERSTASSAGPSQPPWRLLPWRHAAQPAHSSFRMNDDAKLAAMERCARRSRAARIGYGELAEDRARRVRPRARCRAPRARRRDEATDLDARLSLSSTACARSCSAQADFRESARSVN